MKSRSLQLTESNNAEKLEKIKLNEKLKHKQYQKELIKIQNSSHYLRPESNLLTELHYGEECKTKIIESNHMHKKVMLEFIDTQMKLKEMNHDIDNAYRHFKQASLWVNLEIEKFKRDLYFFQLKSALLNLDEIQTEVKNLEAAFNRLKNARSYQEKTYTYLYENDKLNAIKTSFSDKLQSLENDIIFALNIILSKSEIERLKELSILTFADNLDDLNDGTFNTHRKQINDVKAIMEQIQFEIKLIEKPSFNKHSNDRTAFAKARQQHGCFKKPSHNQANNKIVNKNLHHVKKP